LLTIPTQRAAFIAEGPSLSVLQSWITNENLG
jgi:hypothetical protein